MIFSSLNMLSLLALTTLTLTAAKNVTLELESSDPTFNGKGLSALHFGAALNGVLVTSEPLTYQYNATENSVYQDIAGTPYTLHEQFNELMFQAGYGFSDDLKVSGEYLTLDSSADVFYACKALPWDPYGYTKPEDSYGLAIYKNNPAVNCTQVKIRAY